MRKIIHTNEPKLDILYVSPYIPRECGIATYTKNLIDSINVLNPKKCCSVFAIDNSSGEIQYPPEVLNIINYDQKESFVLAAKKINSSKCDIVHIEHEFGLFGGEYGSNILSLIQNISKPIVITFHTVIEKPDKHLQEIVSKISERVEAIIVMAQEAAKRLNTYYHIDKTKIVFIPHGVPDMPYTLPEKNKKALGYEDRLILSTFGLISRNKGLEHAIQSMPKIVEKFPNALFIISGKTHPVVLFHDGEKYRKYLENLVKDFGLEDNVQFINRYLSYEDIVRLLQATDIYITPYLEAQQITSGTLAYALGAGKAIISTPYVYAKENINSGRGFLVEFKNSDDIADKAIMLLSNNRLRNRMSKKSYYLGRRMIWENVGHQHLNVFEDALNLKRMKRQ